jgi:hypothetical protein
LDHSPTRRASRRSLQSLAKRHDKRIPALNPACVMTVASRKRILQADLNFREVPARTVVAIATIIPQTRGIE